MLRVLGSEPADDYFFDIALIDLKYNSVLAGVGMIKSPTSLNAACSTNNFTCNKCLSTPKNHRQCNVEKSRHHRTWLDILLLLLELRISSGEDKTQVTVDSRG